MIDSSDFRAVSDAVKGVISSLTGYPPQVLKLDLSFDADLGLGELKYNEALGFLGVMFPGTPAPPARFESVRDLAKWFFTGPPEDAALPEPSEPEATGFVEPVGGENAPAGSDRSGRLPRPLSVAPSPPDVDEPVRGGEGRAVGTGDGGPPTDKLPPNPETLPSIHLGSPTTRLPRP